MVSVMLVEDEGMKDSSSPPNAKFEVRTVAFVDILGFSNLVERSVKDDQFFAKLHQALRIVERQGRVWVDSVYSSAGESKEQTLKRVAEMDFRSHVFSDCIILSQRGTTVGPLFIRVVQLAIALLNLGVLVRGGIAQGLLCHDADVVFGPALIEAYHLESRCANFPRILVSQGVHDASHNEIVHFQSEGTESVYILCELLRRDADRLYHLDYLTTTLLSPSSVTGAGASEFMSLMIRTSTLILEEFQRPTQSLETKAKWGCFLDYFNDFARVRTSHIPELAVKPIIMEDDEMDPVVTWDDLRSAYYRGDSGKSSD